MKWIPLSMGVALASFAFLPHSSAQAPVGPTASFEQRVQVDAQRSRKVRTGGGDFDDKTDRITFTVKLTNLDTKAAFNDCKGEFYVWAQAIVNKKAYQLLSADKFTFSLAPRGVHSLESTEGITKFDTTGVRFGAKYDGWVLVVRDSTNKVLLRKASSPAWLTVADEMGELKVQGYYDRNLKMVQSR